MKLQDLIHGSFGDVDKKFAGHPADQNRAQKLLMYVIKNKITWEDLKKEVEKYLKKSSASPDHIKEQIKKMRKLENWVYSNKGT